MEADPFALVEAMTVAGIAVGARTGYLYIRGEYPAAERAVRHAVAAARHHRLLGDDVMGSGRTFDIEIRRGAGAYICGEETALMNSLEGRRGEPRAKPPFPTVSGLFGQPTVINNVETLINVLRIVTEGGPAFASVGSGRSTGTKLFCLSGAVARPGVYEIDMGMTLRELLDLAGGVPPDLRAILLGGAAGTFVTPDQLDVPLTLEDTREIGATLGSGRGPVPRRVRRHGGDPAPDRRVLPRRVLRAVRALPRRDGASGGVARADRARPRDRWADDRAAAAHRRRPRHDRRVDLRSRSDGGVGGALGR